MPRTVRKVTYTKSENPPGSPGLQSGGGGRPSQVSGECTQGCAQHRHGGGRGGGVWVSFEAVLWATNDAPIANVNEFAVLMMLAEKADPDGCNAFPSRPTVWEDSGRGGYPPLALVFTKDVSAEARLNWMKKIADLSRDAWQGRWERPGHLWGTPDDLEGRDGWRDFTGRVPVIATHLEHLRAKGPQGPVWWRFGRNQWQTLTDALTNTHTQAEYLARDETRRAIEDTRREREREQNRRELEAWKAASWACPSCGRDVGPDHTDPDGYRPEEGGLCHVCGQARRELEAARERTGIMARLRARTVDQ